MNTNNKVVIFAAIIAAVATIFAAYLQSTSKNGSGNTVNVSGSEVGGDVIGGNNSKD